MTSKAQDVLSWSCPLCGELLGPLLKLGRNLIQGQYKNYKLRQESDCISQGFLVTELMGSLYIVREFVDDLLSVVQLPTVVSSSCKWKSKDLAVAQSYKASRQRRERESGMLQPHPVPYTAMWTLLFFPFQPHPFSTS